MNLEGLGVAMITPFNEDDTIDFESIPTVVENIIKGRANYILVMGTTAEVSTLSDLEKKKIILAIIDSNQNRLPLVIGIGGNDTFKVIKEIQKTDLSSFQAILSVSPYYNKPTQEGIYQHYKNIAEISPLPIILYNVPSRTGINIEPNTFVRLVENFDNIVAIKEASGNIDQIQQIIKLCPPGVQIISGDDALTLPMLLFGAVGTISVLGNALPVPIVQIFDCVTRGNLKKAYKLHYEMMDIIHLIFEEGNPTGIKALLNVMSICKKNVRLPLMSASSDLFSKIEAVIEKSIYSV
jgi:4-hydroxy-tetrahydrodipicolinate synthase